MSKQERRWQNVIWREWHHCEDEEYARHLFELVADEPVGSGAMTVVIFLTMFYGAMLGLLIGLGVTNWHVLLEPSQWQATWTALAGFIYVGAAIGLASRVPRSRRPTWRRFLMNFEHPLKLIKNNFFVSWLLHGVFSFLIFFMILCYIIFIVISVYFVTTLTLIAVLYYINKTSFYYIFIYYETIVVLYILISIFFTIFYLKFVKKKLIKHFEIFIHKKSKINIINKNNLFFSCFTLVANVYLIGTVTGYITTESEALFGAALGCIVGWVIALVDSYIDDSSASSVSVKGRSTWFWWLGIPSRLQLMAALKQSVARSSVAQEVWSVPLSHIEDDRNSSGAVNTLILGLGSENWVERFTARHRLVTLGGKAVESLQAIAKDDQNPLQSTSVWLLKSIAADTSRFKKQGHRYVCRHDFIRCHPHRVRLSWRASITYYGCRACHQSQEVLECEKIVAVLDTEMTEEHIQQGNVLRVNWRKHQELFDFDEVEIVQASDEQVERFALQVGNDTDKVRQPRYKKMRCVVSCRLSENTKRILSHHFTLYF